MNQKSKTSSRVKSILLAVVGVFVVIQIIPVEASNPPVTAEIQTPPEVDLILKKSCYDCHSHETKWPWYSRIAPVSWLIAHDVNEGRAELNFSTWEAMPDGKKAKKLEEIWEEVEEGEMPLGIYVLMHAEAKLSDQEKQTLRQWATGVE